jgi:hypothetical protein
MTDSATFSLSALPATSVLLPRSTCPKHMARGRRDNVRAVLSGSSLFYFELERSRKVRRLGPKKQRETVRVRRSSGLVPGRGARERKAYRVLTASLSGSGDLSLSVETYFLLSDCFRTVISAFVDIQYCSKRWLNHLNSHSAKMINYIDRIAIAIQYRLN